MGRMQRVAIKACIAITLLAACTPAPIDTVQIPLPAVVKGYGISPVGFPQDYSKFQNFLADVGSLSNSGVMFNGSWQESEAGEIPATAIAVIEQAEVYGYTPIIVFGWRSEEDLHIRVPSNPTNDWTNAEAKQLFMDMLVEFAANYHPPFLFLGNESDAYFISNPDDYARWVSFYNEAYDVIKSVSPETRVGPIFQYERISGQGSFSQWSTPAWGALEAHDLDRVDIFGFTLYPWLSVSTPEEIPADYFVPLTQHAAGKPIAVTETGWPADAFGQSVAWDATPDAQVRFVHALESLLLGLDVRVLNWLHYNQMTPGPETAGFAEFIGVSLRDEQGNPRPAYNAWLDLQP